MLHGGKILIDFSFLITEAPNLIDQMKTAPETVLNYVKGTPGGIEVPKFAPNTSNSSPAGNGSFDKISMPASSDGPDLRGMKPLFKQSLASMAKSVPSAAKEGALFKPDDKFTPDQRLTSQINTSYIDPNNYKTHAEFIKALKDDNEKSERLWAQATGGTGGEIGSGFTSWIPGTDNSRLENRLEHNRALLKKYEGKEGQFNYEFLHGPKPDDPSFLSQYGTALGALGGAALLGAGMYYGYKKYKDYKNKKNQEQWINRNSVYESADSAAGKA